MAFRMNSNKSNMENFDKSQQEITSLQNKIKRLENVIDAAHDAIESMQEEIHSIDTHFENIDEFNKKQHDTFADVWSRIAALETEQAKNDEKSYQSNNNPDELIELIVKVIKCYER